MTVIYGTNLVVDDFRILTQYPLQKFIFFLTHMHADHYVGMKNHWDYGQIYCSDTTKKLLLNKFQVESSIITLPNNTPTIIYLNPQKSLSVEVTFFDSNHCPGSIMILFRGYMGTILHTGDMRFDNKLIYSNPILYPKELRTKDLRFCSIHIDELIFDNTFCDPIFQFAKKEEALQEIKKVIDENRDCRILISIDSLGKEDLLIHLAEHYKTPIVVNSERYKNIKTMNLRPEIFTTNYYEGWIEVITKKERKQRLYDNPTEKTLCIIATGWGNTKHFVSFDKKTHVIGYSLHSNYQELEDFVASIAPASLICISRKNNEQKKFEKIQEFSTNLISLMHYQQKGYAILAEKYTRPWNFSKEYTDLRENAEFQKKLSLELGIMLTPAEIQRENQKMFEKKYHQILQPRKRINKGLKILEPENNKFLQKEQLEQINKEREKNQENNEKIIEIQSSREKSKESQSFPWKNSAILNSSKEILKENSQISNRNIILEEWLMNSLENYQEKQLKNNEKSKELLPQNENNVQSFDKSVFLEEWMINSLDNYQEKELKINKSSKKSFDYSQNNRVSQVFNEISSENRIEIEKLLSNNVPRDLLKQRKAERKENLLKNINNLFEELNLSLDFFCDCDLIENLRKNTMKIDKIRQNI